MVLTPGMNELASSLARLVSDSTQVDALYRSLGDQCHDWRNLLNALKLSLHLARRTAGEPERAFWTEVDERYQRLEAFVEDLQLICRPIALVTIRLPFSAFLLDRMPDWSRLLAEGGCWLETPDGLGAGHVELDLMRMTRAIDSFVAWRAEVIGTPGAVRLGVCADADSLRFDWVEQAPPNPILEASQETRLALPLLIRVVSLHGGELEVLEEAGMTVRIRLPLAASEPEPEDESDPNEPIRTSKCRSPEQRGLPAQSRP